LTSFNYKARNSYGALTTGTIDAQDQRAVVVQLERLKLIPISITLSVAQNPSSRLADWWASIQPVSAEEMMVFTRQLYSILDAGIPLTTGLDAVAEQLRNANLKQAVLKIRKDVEGGSSFSDALARNKRLFSPLVINMVRAGEKAGILPQVLERVSNLMEYDAKTADRIKTATRYPMIVLFTLIMAIIGLNIYVIPKFATFFTAFKMDLPLPTKILMATNYIIVNYWFLFVIGFILLGYTFKRVLDTETGRYNWDRLMLVTPVFGPLFSKIYLSRFGRMLSAMLASGIPILDALTIVSATIENKVISKSIITVRDEVFGGKTLAEPMRTSKIFPPIAISMVAIGEKVGMLEKMLDKMADYFEREVDYTIKNLTPLLEPILIFGLAFILLIFALGIFLPMWNVVNITKSS